MGLSYSRARTVDCWGQTYLEITKYLTPPDIISLLRSCKLLWWFLSRCDIVWRLVLQNSPTIPARPGDRRYITWALLYCTIECSVCGTETQNPISTSLKARLCDSCERNELVASLWQAPGGYRYWNQGAHSFEQVVLRRDLERWIGGGGKVESPDVGPKRAAIMYSAHPINANWLHPQVMQMRVAAEQGPPPERLPTFFSQQISDAWLHPDIQRMRLDSRPSQAHPEVQGIRTTAAEQERLSDNPTSTPTGLTLADVEELTKLEDMKGPPSPSSSDGGDSSTSGSSLRF